MRGKETSLTTPNGCVRITPAYAGKRNILEESSPIHKDHPRVCGEKLCFHAVARSQLGSPPHMRGKAQAHLNGAEYLRITPAYAGKRRRARPWTLPYWDHPRVCGEKSRSSSASSAASGSPPRMRGKASFFGTFRPGVRITPAYAGKRTRGSEYMTQKRDHPRVCGEKIHAVLHHLRRLGSPPRMRGKVNDRGLRSLRSGITPAYAGKSKPQEAQAASNGDHPRVCGEKDKGFFQPLQEVGSPPRMRGKALYVDGLRPCQGITPAYAGKSSFIPAVGVQIGDHPRVCGEKAVRSAPGT